MSEDSSIISTDNLQTFVAAAFILAVFSLVFNIYLFRQVNVATAGLLGFDVAMIERNKSNNTEFKARLDALEAELKTVQSELAEQKAAATQLAAAQAAAEPEAATP